MVNLGELDIALVTSELMRAVSRCTCQHHQDADCFRRTQYTPHAASTDIVGIHSLIVSFYYERRK